MTRRQAMMALLGPVLFGVGPGCFTPRPPGRLVVRMSSLQFEPAVATVSTGDVVEWRNDDPFPHTVTAATGVLDSPDIAPGESWTWVAVDPGDVPYVCTYHPTMTGRIRVRGAV